MDKEIDSCMPERLEQLEELAKPAILFLRENYHPHCSLIITTNSAKIVEDLASVPFK